MSHVTDMAQEHAAAERLAPDIANAASKAFRIFNELSPGGLSDCGWAVEGAPTARAHDSHRRPQFPDRARMRMLPKEAWGPEDMRALVFLLLSLSSAARALG